MAPRRSSANSKGIEDLEALKDELLDTLAGPRHDPPLSAQRAGSFMKYIDKRYSQPEQRWTTSAPGDSKDVLDEVTSDRSGEGIEVSRTDPDTTTPLSPLLDGNQVRRLTSSINEQPLPSNTKNWNDIPDDMIERNPGKTTPRSKAEANRRRKFRKRKISNRQKFVPEGYQSFSRHTLPDSTDNVSAAQEADMVRTHPPALPWIVCTNNKQPQNPEKFRIHNTAKLRLDGQLQKFKLRRSASFINRDQAFIAEPYIEEQATSTSGAAEGHDHDDTDSECSDNFDFEDVEFEEVNASRIAKEANAHLGRDEGALSTLEATSDGAASETLGTKTEHSNVHVNDSLTASSILVKSDDEFADYCYNYLNEKKAAGEPTILPKEMLDKLRARTKADEEQRREQDPNYQHSLLMAKVNAAQARREADIPHEALYPEVIQAEKCILDDENWDLLDDFEMKAEPGNDGWSVYGMKPQSDGNVKGNGNTASASGIAEQSVTIGSTYKPSSSGNWVSKVGRVFTFKKGPKDPQKAGWTLADIPEEGDKR